MPAVIASSRSQKREAMAGARASRRARVTSTSRPPSATAKSWAARPIRRSSPGSPSSWRTRGASHGSGIGSCGQTPSLSPPRMTRSAGLQPGLDQAPDEQARMLAVGRPHRDRVEQLLEQGRQARGRDPLGAVDRSGLGGGEQLRGRPAGGPGPYRLAGQLRGGFAKQAEQPGEAGAIALEPLLERPQERRDVPPPDAARSRRSRSRSLRSEDIR
jgi:hypothetical protein